MSASDVAAGVPERQRAQWLTLAVAMVLASWAVPSWWGFEVLHERGVWGLDRLSAEAFAQGVQMLFAVLLVAAAPRASGLTLGSLRGRGLPVLLVCGLPVLLAALVYPRLPVRPFAGSGAEMWLLSPLSQSLIFLGFLYGRLAPVFPGLVHPRLPLPRVLAVVGLLFAAWHLPNLYTMPAGYVAFQLAYTFAGFVTTGLSRYWTGSLLYAAAAHVAVNLIAWGYGA